MPVYRLPRAILFPDPNEAEEGLLAIGGDLSPERLVAAYSLGIFPWYNEGDPILWHSPDPRCVLLTDRVHIGRTLRRFLRQRIYRTTFDRAFAAVVGNCQQMLRPNQDGTWITSEMAHAYERLHELGLAHSVEVWKGDDLVGGMYGVSLGRMFFGESMFSQADNASKVALVTLAKTLRPLNFPCIDAQVATPTTRSLGAVEWTRAHFLKVLSETLEGQTLRGSWASMPAHDMSNT